MAFIVASKHEYWWPAVAKVPNDGKFDEQSFQILFETIDPTEAARIEKEINAAELKRDYSKSNNLLKRIVKGWKDVQGESNREMPFSEEAFDSACKLAWFRLAVFTAWSESQSGIERARGN